MQKNPVLQACYYNNVSCILFMVYKQSIIQNSKNCCNERNNTKFNTYNGNEIVM